MCGCTPSPGTHVIRFHIPGCRRWTLSPLAGPLNINLPRRWLALGRQPRKTFLAPGLCTAINTPVFYRRKRLSFIGIFCATVSQGTHSRVHDEMLGSLHAAHPPCAWTQLWCREVEGRVESACLFVVLLFFNSLWPAGFIKLGFEHTHSSTKTSWWLRGDQFDLLPAGITAK